MDFGITPYEPIVAPQVKNNMWMKFYMLYLIPMDLQHESKLKRLRIVYLPPTIIVGLKNPDFQTLSPFFLDGVFFLR